uniref:Uncharacterized protein n=1 Tax=Lygus hesperus TaxID=30085 RepID=A0A0A9YHS4_LYGHE
MHRRVYGVDKLQWWGRWYIVAVLTSQRLSTPSPNLSTLAGMDCLFFFTLRKQRKADGVNDELGMHARQGHRLIKTGRLSNALSYTKARWQRQSQLDKSQLLLIICFVLWTSLFFTLVSAAIPIP